MSATFHVKFVVLNISEFHETPLNFSFRAQTFEGALRKDRLGRKRRQRKRKKTENFVDISKHAAIKFCSNFTNKNIISGI